MKFFEPSDLEYYSSVRGKQYSSGKELEKVRKVLAVGGAFAKTWHQADLIKNEGYPADYSHHWQSSDYVMIV